MRAALIAALVGVLLAAVVVLVAGNGTPADDATGIPLVTPPALVAADGTSIPLAPNVADLGTSSQRDRYATQLLTGEHLADHLPTARAACQIMETGTAPIGAVANVAATDALPPDTAGKVVYAATLSYCPAYRAAFDNLLALRHGGLAGAAVTGAQPSVSPSTRTRITSSPRAPTRSSERSSTSRRAGADTSPGCGQRAVARGRFNPSCQEYQGYLDPGRAGGRGPSSGDLQTEYGCQQGYIPESECPG